MTVAITNVRERLLAALHYHQREADKAAAKSRDKRASRHTAHDWERLRALHQHHADTMAAVLNGWAPT